MSPAQRVGKRLFDIAFSLIVLIVAFPFILLAVALATGDTREFGLFTQRRVGRYGRLFRVCKVRTMRSVTGHATTVTTASDGRITRLGHLLRKAKLDELPQFFNVLIGNMSVVGPRPDMPGYADTLRGHDRVVLAVRPGITGPASIYFRDEEDILGRVDDAEHYNDTALWPAKVAINVKYFDHYSFLEDIKLIVDTAWPSLHCSDASRQRQRAEEERIGIFANGDASVITEKDG